MRKRLAVGSLGSAVMLAWTGFAQAATVVANNRAPSR